MSIRNLKNWQHEISGDRITLKILEPAHVTERYVSWLNDKDVGQYLESRFQTHSEVDVRAYVQEMFENANVAFYGIYLKDSAKHIGNIKIDPVRWFHGRADLGLLIGEKDEWGKGYATEAIALATKVCFEEFGMRRVQAGAYAENQGSIKAFKKAGFTLESMQDSYWLMDNGSVQDNVVLRILHDEFRGGQSHG